MSDERTLNEPLDGREQVRQKRPKST